MTPEQHSRYNKRYLSTAKGAEVSARAKREWRARINAERLARGDCLRCGSPGGPHCERCKALHRERAARYRMRRRGHAWTEAMKQADRIAEMRELSELFLMGSLRFTAMDLGRKAA